MKIKIVSDSSANIKAVSDPDIGFAPLTITIGGREFTDNADLDVTAMMQAMKAEKHASSTACPSTEDWIRAFDDADIVYGAAITSKLSGCYNSARLAAEEYMERKPGAKVFIMDSLTTGAELQLILEKYRDMVREGLSFDDVVAGIRAYAQRTRLMFILGSLDNLARNGRVNKLVAKAAGILNIRLVCRASTGGELEPMHKCRGEKRSIAQLVASMREAGCNGGRIRITHAANPEGAAKLVELMRAEWPAAEITVAPSGGLCSYYAEEGSLMVGFETI